MSYRSATVAAAAVLICAGTPASATVTYQFTGTPDLGNPISATFTVPTFLTGIGTVPAADLTSCTPNTVFGPATCGDVSFNDNVGGLVEFGLTTNITSGGDLNFITYFTTGAFGSDGTYYSFANYPTATLVVSGTPDAVPEPGTWAMMLLGFSAIGISLKRRRRRAQIA